MTRSDRGEHVPAIAAASHGCATTASLPPEARRRNGQIVGQPQQVITGLLDHVEQAGSRRGVEAFVGAELLRGAFQRRDGAV